LSKKNKAIIGDLKREDFILLENGKTQAITHFSREELPLSVVLLLDVSGSVQPIIDEIQRAALAALSQLKPQDKVAIMIFANKPKLICNLTSDRAEVAKRLDDIWSDTADVGLGTFMNLGIYEAARFLRKNTAPTERRAIVMITDDMDTANLRGGPPRDIVLKDLYEGGTTVCAIIVSGAKTALKVAEIGRTVGITAANPSLGATLIFLKILRRISSVSGSAGFYADRTGGVAISTKHVEVANNFVEIMQLLRTRYTMGYAPDDVTPDGKFREIKLTISDRLKKEKGDLHVFARRGYFIRKPIISPEP
jgi:VWFA-related protein